MSMIENELTTLARVVEAEKAERARVRKELLAAIDDLSARVGEAWMLDEIELRRSLDRICPEAG